MSPVWVGMVEVSKSNECELITDSAGAFVWCVTQADSKETFQHKVEQMLTHHKLIFVGLEDVNEIKNDDDLTDEVFELAQRARENERFVLYGKFHTFPHHNA